jgi:hypothetical protein
VIVKYFTSSDKNGRFDITLTTRSNNTVSQDGAKFAPTDYSLEHLTKIFTGQEVVISLLSHDVELDQRILADAARAAGVKLFVPSEFGIRTYIETFPADLSIALVKRKTIKHLKATQDQLPWVAIITNAWIDYVRLALLPLAYAT